MRWCAVQRSVCCCHSSVGRAAGSMSSPLCVSQQHADLQESNTNPLPWSVTSCLLLLNIILHCTEWCPRFPAQRTPSVKSELCISYHRSWIIDFLIGWVICSRKHFQYMGFSYSLLPRAEQGAAGNQAALAPSHPLLPSHHPNPPLKLHLGDSIETNKNFFYSVIKKKTSFFLWRYTYFIFFPLEIGILRAFSFLLAPLWVYSSWVSIVENDCTKRQERNMLSDFFLFLPKSSPLQRSWQEVQREYENLMLPSDTCKSEVKVWVPLKCQPRSE